MVKPSTFQIVCLKDFTPKDNLSECSKLEHPYMGEHTHTHTHTYNLVLLSL